MGWTRASARGPAAAPFSSTGPPWVPPYLLLAVSSRFGGGIGEGEEKWVLAAVFGPGRRRSPPPARLPAAGQKKTAATSAVLRNSGGKKMDGLGFPGFLGLIYTTEIGGLVLSHRSADRRFRSTGGHAGWNQPRRGKALGRLAGPAIGYWAWSPRGHA
jgi:hypothetical protein